MNLSDVTPGSLQLPMYYSSTVGLGEKKDLNSLQ